MPRLVLERRGLAREHVRRDRGRADVDRDRQGIQHADAGDGELATALGRHEAARLGEELDVRRLPARRLADLVDVGGVEFTGNVEISPNFEVNIRPRGITDGPGGRDGGDDGGGADDPVPVPEEEEENSPIIGVLVFSAAAGTNKATLLNSNGGPNIYAPRIASVQFAIKTGDSVGWTADQDVKNLESYVPCPAPQGAIAVRVTPQPGFTLEFDPVRAEPLTTA